MFFGLNGLTELVNFKCGRTACYGTGYMPDDPKKRVGDFFEALQRAANLVARKFGLKTIDEDELIGNGTVRLLNEIAQRSTVGAFAQAPFTWKTAAAAAPELLDALNAIQIGATGPTTPKITPPVVSPTPTTTPTPTPTPTTTRTTTTTKETVTQVIPPGPGPQPKTKIIMGVVAGALVLGAGVAIVAVARKKKHPQPSRGGPSRRARR
jgi:hypothetical protein